jgi:hypothetical protein
LQERLFQQVLAALDPDQVIVDFNDVNERPEVGLPERDRPAAEVLTRGPPEFLDQGRVDPDLRTRLLSGLPLPDRVRP